MHREYEIALREHTIVENNDIELTLIRVDPAE